MVRPLHCQPRAFRRDGAALALSALLGAAAVLSGQLDRFAGIGLIAILLAYVGYTYRVERASPDASAAMHADEASAAGPGPRTPWLALTFLGAGFAVTILGAHLLVGGAVALATGFGVRESLVGLTVVAVGTSLPELVTSVVAAARRHADVAIGNIVGSNIYNVLGILGATAVVHPIAVPPEIAAFDIWVMLGATALLIAFALSGRRLTRIEGGAFVVGFVAYCGLLAAREL